MEDGPTRRHFDWREAREICLAPYLEQELKREAARQASDQREAQRCSGVAWAGLGAAIAPPRPREAVRAAAEAALARAETFAQSPRGRFLANLRALEMAGISTEAARAAFARGFADPDRPACPGEIGVALTRLARIDQPHARAACLALAELLSSSLAMAAA